MNKSQQVINTNKKETDQM